MKQGFLNIGKIFSRKEEKKAYTSIKKLPIGIWWEITEGGNYDKLVLSGSFSLMELYNIYLDLLQQYYDAFGSTEKHREFVKARYNYALKLARYVATQNPMDKMFLEMAKIDLQEVTPRSDEDQKGESLEDIISSLEERYNFEMNEDTLSTHKFYSRLKKALKNG